MYSFCTVLHSVCTAELSSHNYLTGINSRYASGRRYIKWAVYLLCTIRIPLLFLSVGEAQHALAAGLVVLHGWAGITFLMLSTKLPKPLFTL